jgi:hypothetical protein
MLAACLAAPAPLWAVSPFAAVPSVDWNGTPVTPERLASKVTVVLAVDNGAKDLGAQANKELLYQFGANPNFRLLRVVDLVNVPTFASGIVVGTIKKREAAEAEEVQTRFASKGQQARPLVAETAFILDWEGKLRRALLQASPRPEFAIFKLPEERARRFKTQQTRERERLDHHLHIFVLDADGEVKAHYLDPAELPLAVAEVRSKFPPQAQVPPSVPSTPDTSDGADPTALPADSPTPFTGSTPTEDSRSPVPPGQLRGMSGW